MRFAQEWLWRPRYRVWAALPEPYHAEFAARLRERRWHFAPVHGAGGDARRPSESPNALRSQLPGGVHRVATVAPQEPASVDTAAACDGQLTLQSLRMSATVTADRIFVHRAYWLEMRGRPFPAETAGAWQCGSDVVVFL